jgi:DNA repair protein RecO (recombination protein O)
MPLVETESLILKSYDLAEADKIVVLLSREHGILRGVAKGAKRLNSRFGSGLEPFSTVRLTYFQKETLELVKIQKTELIDSYFEIASDPDFLQKFSYLVDILVAALPPQDPNETLYRMILACLKAGAGQPASLPAIGLYFEIWLLKLTGYLPRWFHCRSCGREFNATEDTGLGSDHELYCGSCRRLSSMLQVAAGQRSLLVDALRIAPDEFAEKYRSSIDLRQLSEIFKRVISQSLGRQVSEPPPLAAHINRQ